MKKLISIMMAVALIILSVPLTAAADTDRTAPLINRITINKSEITAPGSFSLTFDMTETETGVSKIWVVFRGRQLISEVNSAISCTQNNVELTTPVIGSNANYTMNFSVGPNCPSDILQISQVEIEDHQGNHRQYYMNEEPIAGGGNAYLADRSNTDNKCYVNNNNTINVRFEGGADLVAPIINNVTIDRTTVAAPGKFNLKLNITEEGTGVNRIVVCFMAKDNSVDSSSVMATVTSPQSNAIIKNPLKSGDYNMQFTVSGDYLGDTIQIAQIDIYDVQGNHRTYWNGQVNLFENGVAYIADQYDNTTRLYINNGNNIDVTFSGARDNIAPRVTGARINKSSMTTPGTFTVTLDIVEEGSGVNMVYLGFADRDGIADSTGVYNTIKSEQLMHPITRPLKSGPYTIEFQVSSKYNGNTIQLSQIDLYDVKGNHSMYLRMGGSYSYENGTAYLCDSREESIRCYISDPDTIEVRPEFDVDFQYHITNPDIVNRLNAMPEGKVALINYDSNNSVAKAAMFDAIRGKNKTIVFSDNAYQWIFNGRDVVNPSKNVNLLFRLSLTSVPEYGTSETVGRVTFASNGLLPGKAEARMKSDYLYSKGRTHPLTLSYMSGDAIVPERNPNFDLVLDGTDKWCHFDITHNSTFFVSSGGINKYPSPLAAIKKLKKGKKSFTVKWAKKACTGYQIRYSLDPGMSKAKTVTIKKKKTTSKQIKKLKKKKTYYVQMRTYTKREGANYYSAWTPVRSVKIK